jgi:hypothetical protein
MKKSSKQIKRNLTRLYRINMCSTNPVECSPLLHKWRFGSHDITNILSIQTKYFFSRAILHLSGSIPNWRSTVKGLNKEARAY